MTYSSETSGPSPELVGPYSPWPRRRNLRRLRRNLAAGAGVATAAVFAHCILPLL